MKGSVSSGSNSSSSSGRGLEIAWDDPGAKDGLGGVSPTGRQHRTSPCAVPGAWFGGEVIHGDYAGYVQEPDLDSLTQYELWKAIRSSVQERNWFRTHVVAEMPRRVRFSFPPLFIATRILGSRAHATTTELTNETVVLIAAGTTGERAELALNLSD